MRKVYQNVILILVVLLTVQTIFAQTYNDGPIQLQVKLRDVRVQYDNPNRRDAVSLQVGNFNLPGSLAGDEFSYTFTIGDNAVQAPPANTGCIQDDLAIVSGTDLSVDHNLLVFNYTYPGATVPQFVTLGIDAFEDDVPSDFSVISGLTPCGSSGGRCSYEASMCCANIPIVGCLFSEQDDHRLVAPNYKTNINYRLGAPCQWYDQGYINGTASSNDYYHPRLETYWRYTGGTSCNTALDLGTLAPGSQPITHFNSNECYSNNFANSPGNDVFYKFHINNPIGVHVSLCGVSGAQYNSVMYLLDNNCTVIDQNDDGCGNQSVIDKSLCVPGDYYIVVDAATAQDLGTFTLTLEENTNFTFSTTVTATDVTCFGRTDGQAQAVVVGGTPNFTYAWSSGGATNPVTGLGGGTISVTVTDANGCAASASATINVPAQIGLTTSSTPVSCGGNDGTATATATGGTTPYSYLWNSLPPQTFATAVLLPVGTYTVTVTDNRGCTVSASAAVASSTTMVLTVDTVINVRCNGANNGAVMITLTGGVTPYTFAWSNQVNTEDNTNLGPGAYTLIVTDNLGCTIGGTWNIIEPPVLTNAVSFTFNPRCNAGSDGIVNIAVGGGTQPYSYSWSPSGATSQNLNNVGAGTHSVTVTDASACTASASATLTEPSPYSISLTSTDLLCYGASNGSASVTVSGQTPGYTYFWSNFATTSTVSGLDGGPFSVVIEDASGCDTIVTGTINSPGEMDIQLTANEPLCADSGNGSITTVVIGGTSPFSYSWTGTGGFTSTQQNPQVGSGSYTVTVTDQNNCTASESAAVNSGSAFTVTAVGINPSCIGDSTGAVAASTTGGNGPYTYAWSTSSADNLSYIEKLPTGSYSVTVTDGNGCQATGQAVLSEPTTNPESCKADKFVVLVPTAFTPNGDNVNDRLVAIMRNVQKLNFSVYNRWGELVYENTNMQPGDGWDGTFRGQAQPVGSFVWVFNVTYANGVHATERGTATLVR